MTRTMKTPALTSVLLAGSLAANAVLAWLLIHRTPEPAPSALSLNTPAPTHSPSAAPASANVNATSL